MLCCCRLLLVAVIALAALGSASAGAPIQFARTPDISPDGRWVVFSYFGDLWVVDVNGGEARHLSMHEAHDFNPVFSPDGKTIAFSSNRHGNYDVFTIPFEGGHPTRLTHDSAEDHVTGWTPDGKSVLFMSGRHTEFPFRVEMYTVPASGSMPRRVSAFEGRDGAISPAGDKIAYTRGPGSWYRKGYKGSSNDDIWVSDFDGANNRQITNHAGQDNYPLWAPDGRSLYFVSDCLGGVANIVRLELDPATSAPAPNAVAVAITKHTDDRVRRARLSRNGDWLVYECGPDLWVHSTKSGQGRKLNIEVHADDKTNREKAVTLTSNATEFSLTSDEKHIAFVVHGEIFMMPRTGGKARRLTDHPANDHGVAWSPDSKRMLFLSDRGGYEDIYLLESDDPEHPDLTAAHRFKTKQLTNTPEAELGVGFAPDGSRVAYIRGGKLLSMKPDGTDEKVIVDQGQVFDYEWSPDGRWICYARSDAFFASELYIIPATGATAADPARNVTRFATYNGGVTWSKTGNKLAFISNRRREGASAYVLSLQRPAANGAAASKDIDWDDIHVRVKLPAAMTTNECAVSSDGSKIAFRATQDGDDLWVANADGGQVTRVTTGGQKPTQIQWSRLFGSQVYYRDGQGHLQTAMVGGANSTAKIPFQARMTVKQDELFGELFEQSWRLLDETFYDSAFHGADWRQVRERFRPLVKHCALREDLYALVSLMLGELNASHLGISAPTSTPDSQTADIGLIFDRAYRGQGLKVVEVLRNGPADQRGLNIKSGDIVFAIDGTDLNDRVDPSELLNDKVGESITLTVAHDETAPKRKVEVQGTARNTIAKLMYARWVAQNARRVQEISGDTMAYIHIPSMDDAGLDQFVRALYSDAFDKEGIVLDVRYNGGGYTHEQVLSYLGGKEHTFFLHRNGSQGLVLNSRDRRWTKPIVLLINNRSYSDAEIFPHAFRTLGLGKLVGQATGGHVIGTRNVQLIDGSQFRTPRIGVKTAKGVNMEKEGVIPDVVVEVHPDQLAKGEDQQLDRAVDVLRQDVAAWKKGRQPVAVQPVEGGAPGAGPGTAPLAPPQRSVTPRRED